MNQHNTQTKDVPCNSQNPQNPDSKPHARNAQNKIILYAKARKFFLYWKNLFYGC
jgi:hypothetical protein